MKAAFHKPAVLFSFIAVIAMATLGVISCGAKNHPGQLSRVILARQRAFAFMFKVDSPGGALGNEELRAFVDGIQASIGDFYKPRVLDEFQVESRGGVIEVDDVAYQAAMAGYDEVFMFEGSVSPGSFNGRLRVVNAAGGGVVLDEELNVTTSAVKVAVADEQTRAVSGIEEATRMTMQDILAEKYRDPYQWQMLGLYKGDQSKMEGIESLAEHFIQQAKVGNIADFQKLTRAEMDQVYPLLSHAQNLYQKIRDGYVSGKIPSNKSSDIARIQRSSAMVKALGDITGFYDDEINVSAEDFKVTFNFPNINADYQKYFQDALAKSTLSEGIRKYTVKPAEIAVSYDPKNDVGTIYLKVRYSNHRFLGWLEGKQNLLLVDNTRTLPFNYFNALMGELVKYHRTVLGLANEFDRKSIGRFNLVLELQRKLLGYAQLQVSVFENQLRPITNIKVKLCDYPPAEIPTSKAGFTNQTKLFALGTPQNIAGQRLPYASIYEFFELDRFFNVSYPKACDLGKATEIYINEGGKGVRQKVTIP